MSQFEKVFYSHKTWCNLIEQKFYKAQNKFLIYFEDKELFDFKYHLAK